MASPRARKPSAFFSIGIKIVLTLAAFWLAFREVQWDALQQMLAGQVLGGVVLAAGCVFAQVLLGALRWQYILAALSDKGKRIMRYRDAFKIYYISVFFSNCLPGTIGGDVVRVWITKSDDISLSLSLNSIIIDRLLALAGLVLVLLIMMPVLADIVGFDMWLVWMGFLALAIIGSWLIIQTDHALERFEHMKPVRWLRYFFNCMRLLIQNPLMSFYSLLAAALSHVFYGICAYALALSMGIELGLVESIALMPLVMFAITMPVSIGGWGVREAVMVQLFALIGIAGTAAVAISLQLGLLNILVSLPAAVLWLAFKKRRNIDNMPVSIPEPLP